MLINTTLPVSKRVVILHHNKLIIIMVKVACPLPECNFETEDLDPAVVVVVLQIHASLHQPGNGSSARGPKLDRPRIDTGADQEAWNTFLRRWENFRVGSNIPDSVAPVQLLQCAGDELSEMLLKTDPGITSRPLQDVLEEMKSLAVIPVAKGIVRAELMQLHQANDESFRAFAAKVRGKAETCGYSLKVTCPCKCNKEFLVDYTVEAIRDVLLAGIGCSDIKQEVLSTDGIHEKTINEIVAFVETREMARNAMSRRTVVAVSNSNMSDNSAAASLSTFKRQKTAYSKPTLQSSRNDQTVPCPECGKAFSPYRRLRNGWNKKPFKECLSCWRTGQRNTRGGVKVQHAECAISQAQPPASRVSAFEDDEQHQMSHHTRFDAGNASLS